MPHSFFVTVRLIEYVFSLLLQRCVCTRATHMPRVSSGMMAVMQTVAVKMLTRMSTDVNKGKLQ